MFRARLLLTSPEFLDDTMSLRRERLLTASAKTLLLIRHRTYRLETQSPCGRDCEQIPPSIDSCSEQNRGTDTPVLEEVCFWHGCFTADDEEVHDFQYANLDDF